MLVDKLTFQSNGWPKVGDGYPTETQQPDFWILLTKGVYDINLYLNFNLLVLFILIEWRINENGIIEELKSN